MGAKRTPRKKAQKGCLARRRKKAASQEGAKRVQKRRKKEDEKKDKKGARRRAGTAQDGHKSVRRTPAQVDARWALRERYKYEEGEKEDEKEGVRLVQEGIRTPRKKGARRAQKLRM